MDAHPFDVPERDPNPPREIPVGSHSIREWPGKAGCGTQPTIPLEGPTLQERLTSEYERGVRAATEYQLTERRLEKSRYADLQSEATSKAYHQGYGDGFANGRACTVERVFMALALTVILLTLLALVQA